MNFNAFLLKNKTRQNFTLLVSDTTSEKLGSGHSILSSKKLKQLKNQLFLGPEKRGGHGAYCCAPDWRNKQMQSRDLREQGLTSGNDCENQCQGRKT